MKGNDKRTAMDKFAEWWGFLDTGEKVAYIWLAIVAVIVVTLGILFPIFGIVILVLGVGIGTIAAVVHIIESSW